MEHFTPRPYQVEISNQAFDILTNYRIVYFGIEVRVGKTFMALMTAQKLNVQNILFVTKKKAIGSIQNDYDILSPGYAITIINFESLHKLENYNFDLIVIDEAHSISAFPKPSKRFKDLKKIAGNKYLILMSGTPTPESHSQWYHQFSVSKNSPFNQYVTFYKWAKDFVNVKQKHLGYAIVNDYSDARIDRIKPLIKRHLITQTQKQSGFETEVKEKIHYVKMMPITYKIIKTLKKDLVVEGKENVILADTAVKLQSKLHQLYSGTVKFESGESKVLDFSKIHFISNEFKGKKIAIFYKFKEELKALQEVFKDNLTIDLDEFNNTSKNIALQFISGKEGISLKNADCLVAINIDFSSSTYWQFRDRLTTLDRKENNLFWIFSIGGIEDKIYNSVMNKKNYTLNIFKKDYGI